MDFYKKNSKGQSIVETLVALTIIVIGVFAAVSLGVYTMRAGQMSKLDIIAENLAREGIEVARNQRDYNWKRGVAWDSGFEHDANYKANVGKPDSNMELKKSTEREVGKEEYRLYEANGEYSHNKENTPTDFYRKVHVLIGGDAVKIDCIVRRESSFGKKDLVVEEWLYDWK